ncbi:IOD2 deiodinase, partial [Atractosteus spatula]|nr:IOD2 deiodinase [Atractosteus spatula]
MDNNTNVAYGVSFERVCIVQQQKIAYLGGKGPFFYNLNEFLDSLMRLLVEGLPSYIKDTKHALRLFNDFQFQGPECYIFTIDITSLYTVNPHNDGPTALKHTLDKCTVLDPPTHTLVCLAELVLTLNAFSFNNLFYQQVIGVAMGWCQAIATSYANIFVGWVEQRFFASYTGFVPDLYK